MKNKRRILTVDIGNSSTKLGVFEGEKPVYAEVCNRLDTDTFNELFARFGFEGVAYSCVGADNEELRGHCSLNGIPFVDVRSASRMPLEIRYDSRSTLGSDRVAAAAGAVSHLESALVADAGTALTCDLVSKGVFLGGNISPGIALRFAALNRHTAALPEVGRDGQLPAFGHDTETAIRAGVVGGVVAEILSSFEEARLTDNDCKLILTGGDADFLAPLLEAKGIAAEVDPDAVGRGLVRIYDYVYE